MSKRKNEIYGLDRTTGEIMNKCLHHNNRKRFQADTPFDKSFVPYFIMTFCAAVDLVIFYNLFSTMSYDSPWMLAVQIGGLLFGFDVVPIYIGIQYKRLKQKVSNDKCVLIIALVAFCFAFLMNIVLRVLTFDEFELSLSQSGSITYAPAIAFAFTVFFIGIPVITSLGSCMISFMTYNPLRIRQKRIAEMIEDTKDEIRRFEAILSDYNAEADFEKKLEEEDDEKFKEMERTHKAQVIDYCDYVRERLKEQLANPTSNNALSESVYDTIISRLEENVLD